MLLQTGVVVLLVAGSGLYAGWTLMPAAARRALARRALRWALPEWAARPLRRAAAPASGCGCDGCDAGAPPNKVTPAQPLTFHRRLP